MVYTNLIGSLEVTQVKDRTYDVVKSADIALVTSGTATLETALIATPQIVCYKTANINYAIGKRLVDLKHISLVNLILDEDAIPELIQSELNSKKLIETIQYVREHKDIIKQKYRRLHTLLDQGKPASELAADIIMNLTKSTI